MLIKLLYYLPLGHNSYNQPLIKMGMPMLTATVGVRVEVMASRGLAQKALERAVVKQMVVV